MTVVVELVAVATAAAVGAACRDWVRHRTHWTATRAVAATCLVASSLGAVYALAPMIGSIAVASVTGFLAASAPLTAIHPVRFGDTYSSFRAALPGLARLGWVLVAHLVYASAFAVTGYAVALAFIRL